MALLNEASNAAVAAFLTTLADLVGDGDLRNLDRITRLLGPDISFKAAPIWDTRGHQKIARFEVVLPGPSTVVRKPSNFRFTFDVQGSVPPFIPNAKIIATILFTYVNEIGCITEGALIHHFGPVQSDGIVLDGPGRVPAFNIGHGSDYRTEIRAYVGKTGCANFIAISEFSQ